MTTIHGSTRHGSPGIRITGVIHGMDRTVAFTHGTRGVHTGIRGGTVVYMLAGEDGTAIRFGPMIPGITTATTAVTGTDTTITATTRTMTVITMAIMMATTTATPIMATTTNPTVWRDSVSAQVVLRPSRHVRHGVSSAV